MDESSFLDSYPAFVRDVEDHAVRVAELALEIDAAAALQLAMEAAAVRLTRRLYFSRSSTMNPMW